MTPPFLSHKHLASLTRRLARLPYACGIKPWIRRLQRDDCERCKGSGKTADLIRLPGTRQKMIVDRSDRIGSLFFWFGSHHRHQISLAKKLLPEAGVFVDVGANVGEFSVSLALAKPKARILAVEPNEPIRSNLQKNLQVNSISNVVVCPLALGDVRAKQTLYQCNDSALTSFVPFTGQHIASDEIDVCTLDELTRTEGLERLDLLKIDVEGYELKVLKGAMTCLERFRPNLILEVNSITSKAAGFDVSDLFELLRSHRYRFLVWRKKRWIESGDETPTQEDIWAEPEEAAANGRRQ